MILTVDIGNSNIVAGCISDKKICFMERLSTDIALTPVEYAVRLKTVFDIYKINCKEIEGSIISSVVPQLTPILSAAIEKLLKSAPLIVGPGLKTGIDIRIDDPAQLGSSLLAYCVAALAEHEPPLIVIEMSTATTFCVVNQKRQYVGGVICSGIRTSLDSLVKNTSLLYQVNLDDPGHIIGTNTVDGLRSGIIYGTASCIDGVVSRIEEQLGETCRKTATGQYAKLIIPKCVSKIEIDDALMVKGLRIIYEKNRGSVRVGA